MWLLAAGLEGIEIQTETVLRIDWQKGLQVSGIDQTSPFHQHNSTRTLPSEVFRLKCNSVLQTFPVAIDIPCSENCKNFKNDQIDPSRTHGTRNWSLQFKISLFIMKLFDAKCRCCEQENVTVKCVLRFPSNQRIYVQRVLADDILWLRKSTQYRRHLLHNGRPDDHLRLESPILVVGCRYNGPNVT